MAEQVWLIEARFKSVGGPWITQLDDKAFMTAEDAEAKVNYYRQRNTLSEWRATRYVAEPSPEPDHQQGQTRQAGRDIAGLVSRFSSALKDKLLEAEAKYNWNGGWKKPDWLDTLRQEIRRHVEKGDPRDVAAYCAFAWHHGWSLSERSPEPEAAPRGCPFETMEWGDAKDAPIAEPQPASAEPDGWNHIIRYKDYADLQAQLAALKQSLGHHIAALEQSLEAATNALQKISDETLHLNIREIANDGLAAAAKALTEPRRALEAAAKLEAR